MSNHDVVVVGSCVIDLISYVRRLPVSGETLIGDKFQIGFGGKGANQAVVASRLGASTVYVSKVGDDSFGRDYIENLKKYNMKTDNVTMLKGESTDVATIAVDSQGQNTIIVTFGASLKLGEEDVMAVEGMLQNCKVVVCQWEIPIKTTLLVLKLAKKHGVKTLFNCAPYHKEGLLDEIYQYCDVICPNEMEAACITGVAIETIDDAKTAALMILDRGSNSVVITLGGKGAVVVSAADREAIHVPAATVDVKDSTGAGDAFMGSLGYFMSAMPGLSLCEMVKRSVTIATVTVTKEGTQSSYSDKHDLPQYLFSD